MTALGIVLGLLIGGGVLLVVVGLQRHEPAVASNATPSRTMSHRLSEMTSLTRTERIRATSAAVIALVFAILTGWVSFVLIAPVVVVLVPRLISNQAEQHRVARLEAMGEWTRSLAGVLSGAGAGLTDALIATLRTAPSPIRPEVERMVARLQAGRPVKETLRGFADDLDDQVGDLIAASLLLGATESGAGLSRILNSLASSVSSQVAIRRTIEAERAGNRSQAKVLSIFAVVALSLFVLFTPFGQTYRTLPGQFALLVIVTMMGACLYWLKKTTSTAPAPRFLPATQPPGGDPK